MKIGEKVDYFFNKMLPKKLLVVALATWVIGKGFDAPDYYWWILLTYMGVNVIKAFAPAIMEKMKRDKDE